MINAPAPGSIAELMNMRPDVYQPELITAEQIEHHLADLDARWFNEDAAVFGMARSLAVRHPSSDRRDWWLQHINQRAEDLIIEHQRRIAESLAFEAAYNARRKAERRTQRRNNQEAHNATHTPASDNSHDLAQSAPVDRQANDRRLDRGDISQRPMGQDPTTRRAAPRHSDPIGRNDATARRAGEDVHKRVPPTTPTSPAHRLTQILQDLAPEAPRRLSAMKATGDRKYVELTTDKVWTPARASEHAAGRATYAASLDRMVDGTRQARAGVLDYDGDGAAIERRLHQAALQLGLQIITIRVPSPDHGDSLHCWALFDMWYPSVDVQHYMQTLATTADAPTAEIWPLRDQGIRLLFGYHNRAQTRGMVTFSSSEHFDLDRELSQATSAIVLNGAPPKAPEVIKVEPVSTRVEIRLLAKTTSAGRASLDDVKAQFNAEHTIAGILAAWGAVETKDGYTCVCGVQHTHPTTLYISRQGRLFSYSPRCELYTSKGWDAFGLYTKLYHNDSAIEAAKTLNPVAPRQKRQQAPLVEPQPVRTQTPEQVADAARKRAERRTTAAHIRQAIIDRAEADRDLSPRAHRQLDTHLVIAGQRGWHRASIARQAELTGIGERAVQFANQELIERGYLSREITSGTTTAIWTFTPRSPVQTSGHFAGSPVLDHESDSIQPIELVSPAPEAQPRGEPETIDQWEAREPDFNPADLAWLYAQEWGVATPEPPLPPAAGPWPAMWHAKDVDYPVTVLSVAGVWADGQVYVWITSESGGKTGVPLDEIEFEQAQPAPKVEPEPLQAVQSRQKRLKAVSEPGGASYDPKLDHTVPRQQRAQKSPTERAAAAKSTRQARWRAMEAPELRRNLIILSRKADKTTHPAQRYALKEQCVEIQHYLALKDAQLDAELALVETPAPVLPRGAHKLAAAGGPLNLAMDFSQASPAPAGAGIPDVPSMIARLKAQRQVEAVAR